MESTTHRREDRKAGTLEDNHLRGEEADAVFGSRADFNFDSPFVKGYGSDAKEDDAEHSEGSGSEDDGSEEVSDSGSSGDASGEEPRSEASEGHPGIEAEETAFEGSMASDEDVDEEEAGSENDDDDVSADDAGSSHHGHKRKRGHGTHRRAKKHKRGKKEKKVGPPPGTSLKEMKRGIDKQPEKFQKSAYGFRAGVWCKAYIDLSISSQTYEKEPLMKFIQNCQQTYGAQERVKALKLDDVHASMAATKNELTQFRDAIDSWSFPVNCVEKRSTLHARIVAWKAACAEAKCHTEALSGMLQEEKEVETAVADKRRKQRDQIRDGLLERNVSKAIAKVTADKLQSSVVDPASIKITLAYDSPGVPRTDSSLAEVSDKPFIVKYVSGAQQRNGLEAYTAKLYEEKKEQICNKMADTKTEMSKSGLGKATTTFDAPGTQFFACKDDGVTRVSAEVESLRSTATCSWTGCSDCSLESWPLFAHPMWLTQYVGNSVITVLPPDMISKTQDVDEYLQNLDGTECRNCKVFHLREGDSVWMPLGFYPVVIGVDPRIQWKSTGEVSVPPVRTKSGATQHHFILYGATPIYDLDFIDRCPKAVRLQIASSLVRAGGLVPKSYRDKAEFTKWIEELKADRSCDSFPVAWFPKPGRTDDRPI